MRLLPSLHIFLGSLLFGYCLFGAIACYPAAVPTYAPKDADFALSCLDGCGKGGAGTAIDVTFGEHGRQIAFCCPARAELLAQLQTIEDWWCDGLEVPAKRIGGLTVATTSSEATGKRGATLDAGQGYVSFNCEQWLPRLIAELKTNRCCS